MNRPTVSPSYDLVAKLTSADVGSKSLDREIYCEIGCSLQDTGRVQNGIWQPRWTVSDPSGRFGISPKSFTGFLDDAIGLLERTLPAWHWAIGNSEHRAWAEVWVPNEREARRTYAETPPLALCAAVLSALQGKA